MATIRQVATLAGVSIGTVSKVLNGRDEKVDPAAKERILASIRTLRYRPPAFEQNQKATISENVGMVVPDLTERPLQRHGYVYGLLDGVLETSALRGWSVTIFADQMWSDVGTAVRRKYDGRCDTLIVVAPQPHRDLVRSLHERGAPIVQVGTTAWLDDVSSVDIDNHEVGRTVARHFLDLGHRRLGYLVDGREQMSSVERYAGFREVGGDTVQRLCIERDETHEQFAHRLAGMGDQRPTALMGWHDGVLVRCIPAFLKVGLEVPRDLSLVGVDNCGESEVFGFGLTSMLNPLDVIGRRAAAMAIDRVLDPTLPREIVKLTSSLHLGVTTAPWKG